MDSLVRPLVTEDEIHTLLDRRASPEALAALQMRVEQDPAARATWEQWRQQRQALQDLHREVLEESVPAALQAPAQRAAHSRQATVHRARWAGMAAGVLLAFGGGWLAHGQWEPTASAGGQALSGAALEQGFFHQAVLAHAVFAPELRHPVEVSADQQAHLVQWLSKRVGKPLKVPYLGAQGFELVGGRLLPGERGARAQFMYQNTAGQRITLYLGAVQAQAANAPAAPGLGTQTTAFRFSGDGAVPGFYWIDQGWGYALSGALPRQELLALAQAVYPQL